MATKTMSFDAFKASANGGLSYDAYKKAATEGGLAYMSPGDYAKAAKADLGEDEEEAEQDEEEEDAEKSEVNASDLLKAISAFEAVEDALVAGGESREEYLTAKFHAGTISKSEQAELGALWAGDDGDDGDDYMAKSDLYGTIESDDPDAAALVDASPLLKSLFDGLDASLGAFGAEIRRDGDTTRTLLRGQGQLVKSLARTVVHQDRLLKAQAQIIDEVGRRLGVLERQPVVRKSVGADPRDVRPRPGVDGQPNKNTKLSKAQVFDALDGMMQKAMEDGDEAAADRLSHATALFESNGSMRPQTLAAVHAWHGK